jgi:hypothetical protein
MRVHDDEGRTRATSQFIPAAVVTCELKQLILEVRSARPRRNVKRPHSTDHVTLARRKRSRKRAEFDVAVGEDVLR